MNASSLAPVLLAATLILATAARAEDAPAATPPNDAAGKARHAEMMKRFDKNGDGVVDEAEKAEAKAAAREKNKERGQKMKAKFDKNGDGVIDDAERAQAAKAMENNPRVIKRFDKDGDGKLNDAEKAAMREEMKENAGKRRGAGAPSE